MKIRAVYKSGLHSDQSGQALVLVLIFLLLGSLILVPVLDQIGTALKTGVAYEDKTKELYAADAGIEDGIWRIKYGGLQSLFGEECYNFIFDSNVSYELDTEVNGLTTNVTIQNIWAPSNVTLTELDLTAEDVLDMFDSEKLKISGSAGAVAGQPFHITIEFTPDTGDNLTIKSVGIWLPQGFTYDEDNPSCDLDKLASIGEPYYRDSVNISDHNGGQAIVWNFDDDSSYPLFTSFPNFSSDNGTLTSTFQFNYELHPTHPERTPSGIAWVVTEMTDAYGAPKDNDVPISWDIYRQIYKITSLAGGTRVEAYTSKLELRDLQEAIAGDYVAIGNSLMDTPVSNIYQTLHESSSTTLTTNPASADVIAAYLYWSGYRSYTTISTDTCSNFNNWNRSYDGSSQTRVPTGDGNNHGTWNSSPRWDDVDETTPNDSDYITGTTDSGENYQLFTFSPFSIPAGSPIANLNIYFRARDSSSGTNNIRASIKVNGNRYEAVLSENPGTAFTTYGYSFSINPDTGLDWTVDDLNGTGSSPLEQFGVFSTDLNPDIRVSMVYAEVNFSCWIINAGQFQGTGSSSATAAQKTITLKNSIDLSSYASGGKVALTWEQTESGTLEGDDALYIAFSGNGGSTWSENFKIFSDDGPTSPDGYIIPDEYATSAFKARFTFNFDSYNEFLILDDISFKYLPVDSSVTFAIDDEQVYLDGSGDPQSGPGEIEASDSSVLLNIAWDGFSYACRQDVTDLVMQYPEVEGEEHHTGNAKYTVGGVTANTGTHVSYAGWSLIIVYFSPDTAGHYLYLYDVFSVNPQYSDLDFDYDEEPGGEITGFVIPDPIKDKDGNILETIAARLTVFVGEGDAWLYDTDLPSAANSWDETTDCVRIVGQTSGASMFLSNDNSPEYNVWNSSSYPGTSHIGVDIDTFEILWTDNIFVPKDERVTLHMYSGQDFWNLVYFILSVRSKTIVGSTEYYTISNN